jgi:hypothetical protein
MASIVRLPGNVNRLSTENERLYPSLNPTFVGKRQKLTGIVSRGTVTGEHKRTGL